MRARRRKLTDDKIQQLLAWKGFGVLCRELGISRSQGNGLRYRFKSYGYCYKIDRERGKS
jgi:hypothetical protein